MKSENEKKETTTTNECRKSNKRSGRKPYSNKGKGKYIKKDVEKKAPLQESSTRGDDINDSTFYYQDKILLEQMTNFSFNQFAGVPFKVGNKIASSDALNAEIPTIMTIKLNPNAGMKVTGLGILSVTDGVFKAGLKNYYMLSAGNAKTTNYQPQDLTMLIFSLCSVMEWVSFLQRVMGTPYFFNVRNRDLPKELLKAQGIQYEDLVKNMAAYRIRFNTILQTINKIPIPDNVKAFMKSSALYSNYYTDDTSPMSQFYVLMPKSLWIYNEESEPDILQPVFPTGSYSNPKLFSTLLDTLDSMVTAILTSAKFNYIFADILRLSDKGSLKTFKYGLIPDGYIAPILYSEEFNLWIDNAVPLRDPEGSQVENATISNTVYDNIDANTLNYSPAFKCWESWINTQYVINFDKNDPTTEDRVAATRFIAGYYPCTEYAAGSCYVKAIASTHYITDLTVLDGHEEIAIPNFGVIGYDSGSNAARFLYMLRVFDLLSKFKHAPHIHVYNMDATGDQNVLDSSNYEFWTTVDLNYLSRMFDAEWLTYLTIE